MVQAELPIVYARVYQIDFLKKYQLPLRWKAVFVLLIIYSIVLSTITYVEATQTRSETAKVPVVTNTEPPTSSAKVKMTATVPGWYEIEEIDNENIHIKTNMKVWVNGREFIRCDNCEQEKMDPPLLEF